MKLQNIFRSRPVKGAKRTSTLRIDCRKCERSPDYGCAVCIRCMCRRIGEGYRPDTIVLDSGVEMEYSGESARLICDLSDCVPKEFSQLKDKRCSKCELSPLSIDDEMWNLFSIDAIDSLISRLDNAVTDGKECQKCVSDSRNRLQETRNRLYVVSKDALATAYKIIGV